MILTKHEKTKKGRLFHENEKLRIFVSSCSINHLYQVVFGVITKYANLESAFNIQHRICI